MTNAARQKQIHKDTRMTHKHKKMCVCRNTRNSHTHVFTHKKKPVPFLSQQNPVSPPGTQMQLNLYVEGQPSENLLHIIDVAARANVNTCPETQTQTATLIKKWLIHVHSHAHAHKHIRTVTQLSRR